MACKYIYNGQTYTKDEFYSLVRTTMVQPKTVQKYTKILFPTGNTVSKVEGHTTLEEFKKQKEDRIKEREESRDVEIEKFIVSIFPNTNIKQIAYHGSPNKIEKFDKSKLGINTGSESAKNAFFFASNPFTSFVYTWKSWDMGQDEYSGGMEYAAINQIGKFAERFNEKTSLKELLSDKEVQNISSNNIYLHILETLKNFDTSNKTQSIFFPISKNQSVRFEKDYSNKTKGVFILTTEGVGEENFFGVKQQENIISEKEFDSLVKKGIEYLEGIKPNIKIYQVVLNSQNPLIVDDENQGFRQETYSDRVNKAKKENNDSVIINNTADPVPNSDIFAVFEAEQIHILTEKELDKLDAINNKYEREITQLKQELERIETEGFGALKPIYNFYENTVTNILKKNFKVNQITDEYGNTWNEIELNESHLDIIYFQRKQGVQSFDEETAKEVTSILQEIYPEISLEYTELQGVRGQANIKAGKVLIDALNQNTDTLAHEYAHHYISWFKNSPIVQKGIRLFGSEEALVQAIGEQTTTQKAKANIWYKQFWNWIKSLFNNKQAQLERLTDAFINKKSLGEKEVNTEVHYQTINPESIKSDEKLIKTITAAKLVFKNREAELARQYGSERVGTRISIQRIRAALEKLTVFATYSDLLSVAVSQLDVVHNVLDRDYKDISNIDFIDVKKILYFTSEFDKMLLNAPEDEGLSKKIDKVRSDSVKLQAKFDKLIQKRLIEASKYYGREITQNDLDAAYTDIGGAKAATMSLETTHIPHLQFGAAIINWRARQTDQEVNNFDDEHRALVKKFSEEEFKKIFDASGRLISMYSPEFYQEEAKLFKALRDVQNDPNHTKADYLVAKNALEEWFMQNYTYKLTPEGQELYNKHLEEVIQSNKFDGETDQDAVEKFKQQYHWDNMGKVNPDGSFTITQNSAPRANIGGKLVTADKWYSYLVRTPIEKHKNADFDKVKDLEVYNWYVDKVQEIYDKTSPSITTDLGMYDKFIQHVKYDLTESKFSLDNIYKGVGQGMLGWVTTQLTHSQVQGEHEQLTDEKGRLKPIVKPKNIVEVQLQHQFKDPVELLRKAYEMAVTYEHKTEIQPLLELVGYELEKLQKLEKNPITDQVRKDLNKDPLKTAGGLINAINAFKYRETAELTGRKRTDESSGMVTDVTEEEKADLAKRHQEWIDSGMIGDEPVLNKFSLIKLSDSLVDYTRLNLIGLKPFSALANVTIGMVNNYIYAAREKDFNTKDLDWATVKLRNSVLKWVTFNKAVSKDAMKIASLALKFGVVKDTFIEDASEYGQQKYFKKISEVLFLLQESGEYLIANQILLAKMHNTKITNLAGKEKTLFDAYDEYGAWKTAEFGEAPEWTKLVHTNEEGLNISKLAKFRDRIDVVRHRTQGDYNTPMPFKGKWYGRIFMIFRTWLPRAVEERFGAENPYTETKGRMVTFGQGFMKATRADGALKGSTKFLGGTLLTTLAKLTNLPIIGEHIGKNPLAAGAVTSYEAYLKSVGLSDLDVENMRAQIAEFRMIILMVGLAMVFKGLSGGGDDDPELNGTVNLLQRVYQDLTFFITPNSAFAIIKDPIPIKKTIMDGVEAINASLNYISNPEKDTYKKGFRKGRSKTAKEWHDLIPVLSAWNTTEATLNQVFGADSYKYTKK